jgi:hypothetical protein
MLRPWVRVFGLFLFVLPVSLVSAQDVTSSKTITFVVSMQHYDDPDPNEAENVFERLKAVSNPDLERIAMSRGTSP